MLKDMQGSSATERVYSREPTGPRVEILGPHVERQEEALTPLALQLLASLHRRFNPRRLELLAERTRRQGEFDAGALPEFPASTAAIRAGSSQISPVPVRLSGRRIEIAGHVDRKTIRNARKASVKTLMAD